MQYVRVAGGEAEWDRFSIYLSLHNPRVSSIRPAVDRVNSAAAPAVVVYPTPASVWNSRGVSTADCNRISSGGQAIRGELASGEGNTIDASGRLVIGEVQPGSIDCPIR